MLDTVGLGVRVGGLRIGGLLERGWSVYTRTSLDGGDVWASTEAGGVRLSYGAGFAWLAAEASLPPLMGIPNSELLDLAQCREAVKMMRGVAEAAVGAELPSLDDWRASRFDVVWSWACEPSLYLGALVGARLPRTEPVRYGSSVLWKTRGGRTRARLYDKAEEVGAVVGLPHRLERQVRRREVVKVDGVKVGRAVGDVLSEKVCFGVLRDSLADLGLDRPIPSVGQTRSLLVNALGARAGRNSWSLLHYLIESGGVWPSDVSEWTRRKCEREWRAVGVSAVSAVGELPPLTLPERASSEGSEAQETERAERV